MRHGPGVETQCRRARREDVCHPSRTPEGIEAKSRERRRDAHDSHVEDLFRCRLGIGREQDGEQQERGKFAYGPRHDGELTKLTIDLPASRNDWHHDAQ